MKIWRKACLSVLLSVMLIVFAGECVWAADDIKITNLNTNKTTVLTYAKNGKIECDNGIITFKYVNNGNTTYRKIIFTNGTFKQYDIDGNQVGGTYNKPGYAFQALLSKAKAGGTLTIRFYRGTFRLYGPYRIYGNTSLISPNQDAVFEKQNNVYTFINTDDAAAKNYDFSKGNYAGSGNIKFDGLDFNMMGLNPQIGKFIHASNINIVNCTFRNGRYNSHVFELTSLKNVKFSNCLFKNLLVDIGDTKTGDHEVIQIESAMKKAFPYCLYKEYGYSQRCTGVSIESCKFNKILRGVGNHSSSSDSQNYQENIKIKNTIFKNVVEDGIHFEDKTKYTVEK